MRWEEGMRDRKGGEGERLSHQPLSTSHRATALRSVRTNPTFLGLPWQACAFHLCPPGIRRGERQESPPRHG